jgi:hypothetical protein
MLFQTTVLRYDIPQFIRAASFLGPFCFTLFIFLAVFVCMNMFVSIITQNFRQSRENIDNDQEIYSFIFERFLHWTGKRKVQLMMMIILR